jgi:HAD superfamily hydrolase (TIGR01509 family)
VQRLADRKEKLYREGIRGKVVAMPGVTELIHGLKAAGFHLAIGSSTPRANVDLVLSELGIQDLFQVIVAGEDVTKGKPDPQVFLLAAERLGIPPERCLVVEDAVAGVRAALDGGMKALAVTTNHSRQALSEAHRVVDSFTEVSPQDVLALLGE